MTNFYADHVLINGQALAASYSKSPRTNAITVQFSNESEKAKIRVKVEDDQYPEAYTAWHESLQNAKQDKEPADIFALLNEEMPRPVFDPSKMAADMLPVARPEPKKEPATPTIRGNGFQIVFNEDLNRTQIIFTKFPNKAARELVKEAGFFWSPNNHAWQKKLTSKARRAAEEVAAKLAGMKLAA